MHRNFIFAAKNGKVRVFVREDDTPATRVEESSRPKHQVDHAKIFVRPEVSVRMNCPHLAAVRSINVKGDEGNSQSQLLIPG